MMHTRHACLVQTSLLCLCTPWFVYPQVFIIALATVSVTLMVWRPDTKLRLGVNPTRCVAVSHTKAPMTPPVKLGNPHQHEASKIQPPQTSLHRSACRLRNVRVVLCSAGSPFSFEKLMPLTQ